MREEEAKKIMDNLKKDYNLISSSFAKSRDRLWGEMKFLFDYAEKGDDVLDLGCGNGRFSKYLEHTNYKGVDFSELIIEEARKRFPEKEFIVADILSLPFDDNSFDKVYSIAVIHQIPSLEYRIKALEEVKRILRPGGHFYGVVWNIWKNNKLLCIKHMIMNFFSPRHLGPRDIFLKRDRYYYVFRKKEFSMIAKRAGLIPIEEGVLEEGKRNNFYIIAKNKENI